MHDSHLIDQYVRWLETLVKTGGHRIGSFVAKDVRHRTPEQEGAGVDAVAAIFVSVFDGAASVKFKVTDRAMGLDGRTVYLRWDRLVTFTDGKTETLSGISELMIGMDDKIASIIDHWDSMPAGPPRSLLSRLFKS
jgi:hypothetical protein